MPNPPITINATPEREPIENLDFIEVNCGEESKEIVETGYSVIFPLQEGVKPGSKESQLIPACGGATVKFYPESNSHGSIGKKISASISGKITDLNKQIEDVSLIKISSLEDTYSSKLLKAKLKLQKILFESSKTISDGLPDISFQFVTSLNNLWKEESKLETYKDFQDLLAKESDAYFDSLGKFNFLSNSTILKILEVFIPGSYYETQNTYYSIVKTNSGISLYSLYRYIAIYSGVEDTKYSEYLNGKAFQEYSANSDAKKYIDASNDYEWNTSTEAPPLDFLIREFFDFFIPYIKVSDFGPEQQNKCCGFFTFFDFPSEDGVSQSIGYLKTPDFSFEDADGEVNSGGEISFGYNKNEDSGLFEDISSPKKQFLSLYLDLKGFGSKRVLPAKYLPKPIIRLSGDINEDGTYSVIIDSAGNLSVDFDVSDILGGEFEAFGFERAPKESDYLLKTSLSSGVVGEFQTFYFMNNNIVKTMNLKDLQHFSYPNILGGLALDSSLDITINDQELKKENFLSGNFNIAFIEELSRKEASGEGEAKKGYVREKMEDAFGKWHRKQISEVSTKEYTEGEDSGFYSPGIPESKGLSADMEKSFGSYRSYLISNGIPNNQEFASIFGFESLKDYLNFKGDVHNLFLSNYFYEKKEAKIKNKILEENKFLESEDGILFCRPRIVDNSSNIIGDHLSDTLFSSLELKEGTLPGEANDIRYEIKRKDISLENITATSKDIFITFQIIDSLGQFTRVNGSVKIKKNSDLSTVSETTQFSSDGANPVSPIKIPLISDGDSKLENETVTVTLYTTAPDGGLGSTVGVAEANLTVTGFDTAEITTPFLSNWIDEFSVSEDTVGNFKLVVSNSFSETPPMDLNLNQNGISNIIKEKEFRISNKRITDIPVSVFGDLPEIKIKSKSKLFGKGKDSRFYFAAIVDNNSKKEEALKAFSKFSLLQDIYIIKFKDKEAVISKDFYLSEEDGRLSDPGNNKHMSFQFPPKKYSRRNIKSLCNLTGVKFSIIGTLGPISFVSEPLDQPTSDYSDYLYFDEIPEYLKTKITTLKSNFYSIAAEEISLQKTPDILEMCFLGNEEKSIRTVKKLAYLSNFVPREGVFNQDLLNKITNSKPSSNLDLDDKKGNLVIAIDGSYYNPKDLFVYTRDELGNLKEIDGKLKKNEDYIYLDEGKDKTYIFIKKFTVPESTEFSIEVFYKDKKLNSLISSSNSKIDSYLIKGEEFGLSEDESKVVLKKRLNVNLEKEKYNFISEEFLAGRGVFYIKIPKTLYYKIRSDYEAFGSSILNEGTEEISIFDESNSGFKIPQIEDLNINFPPSIGDIFDAFKPKISIEADAGGGSFSVSVTNPVDLYTKANSLGSLEKIDLISESESPKYASNKYIEEILSIYLKEGQEILSEYFQLGDNQAIVHIPLSVIGPERITVGQVIVEKIDDGQGDTFTAEDNFNGLSIDGSQNSVFKFTMSGILPAGSGVQFNGYELSGTSEVVGGKTVFSVPVNEDTFKEANIASNLIKATGFTPIATGPCPDYIGVTETGSEIRESGKDPTFFSKGNEEDVDDETYYGVDAVDSDTVMSDTELEKMEIGYGKSLIRKPLSGTAEAIRSLCDLSFHMTSEFRAQLRGFQNILVIIKVIFCIIDVICALGNPAKLGRAILRLFICLTDLLQLLPQVAIPLSFLKLLSHSINLGTCLITKLLRTYSALSEIASAIDEAIILKDYAALTRLEKTLNKHIITINADISVLDPILDIIDIFKEMLELAFLFPCSNDADEKVFNACGSDNSVCSIVIGTLIQNNSLNVESLFPVVQSYATIGTENLTVDSSGAATVNCGNTPPDGLTSDSRSDICFGSDSSNGIFIEPRLEPDTLPIIDISDFGESDYSIEKLRTTSGDIESSFSASFTRSKRPALDASTIVSADLRKCSFEFNYKGITNRLAFDNFLYWLFPNRTIDINKTSDSPIIPMKKSGNNLYLDKDFSDGITLYNPSTGTEVSLKGNETDGFTIPSLTISYLDENGEEKSTDESEYSVPSIVMVDESLAVYKIDKIYVNSDSSSDEFGINRIDATRADYPSFDAKKFSKEDEQYISDPKIYYANANYLALKSFFSSGDYGDSTLFKTDNVSGTPPEVTDDSVSIMESIIFLFHEDGSDLYGEYGIINTNTALNSKVISSSSNHIISANGTGSFNFKGGAIFKKVFDELIAQGSALTWLVEGTADFDAARDAYLELFESETLLENFGSFPYTEYVHKDQTFRDPTQAYLNAYTSSIGTASVFDFPTLYFFDMNTIMEDLIDMCNNNNNLVDDTGTEDLKNALDSFLDCCSKPKKNLEERVNLMKDRLSKGQTISDLPFLSDPATGARDIVEFVECSRDIAKSICSLAISYTASEFLLLENAYGSSSTVYYSGSADESSPLLADDEVDLDVLLEDGFDIGAAKHSLGIGDFGEYFVDSAIPVRVVLRATDGESIGRENLEFESSIRINIIEDTGGNLIIDEEDGVQFKLVKVNDDNGNEIFAYEAIMRSSVPTEAIISCTACSENIKSYIDSSIKSQLEREIESCNGGLVQEQIEAIAFGAQTTVDRTLNFSITSKPEAILLQESDSGSFKSKNQPQIFGSQE